MCKHLIIQRPREERALRALLAHHSISVKDIGIAIGALNPRQTIMQLRNRGFRSIILTRRFEIVDKDGCICRPGEYYIPDELKPQVRDALDKVCNPFSKAKPIDANHRTDNKGGQ
jgi:hypothetical protein